MNAIADLPITFLETFLEVSRSLKCARDRKNGGLLIVMSSGAVRNTFAVSFIARARSLGSKDALTVFTTYSTSFTHSLTRLHLVSSEKEGSEKLENPATSTHNAHYLADQKALPLSRTSRAQLGNCERNLEP